MKRLKRFLNGGGRFIIILLLAVASFSYAMFQGGFVSWFVFYSITPFIFYSILLTFIPIRIEEVRREIKPSKLRRGDSAVVTVSFRNKTWFPLVFLTVKELGIDSQKVTLHENFSRIYFVGWKRKFEWTYELNELERGKIHFKGLHLTIADFFGWSIRRKVIEESTTIIVLPRVVEVKYKPLQMQFEHGGVVSPFSMVKDTSLVTGIRDYQSGDKYSWIHWKSFAKNETLRTKEFEDRQTQDLFLTIDQSSVRNFEYAVDLAASILQSVVLHHGEISFLSTGKRRRYFPNLKSQNQLEDVMQHLAEVESNPKQSIEAVLANEIGLLNSATLMLITGEFTEQLKSFVMNSSKFACNIICFVVTDESGRFTESRMKLTNAKIIYISKDRFENVFTEVMKP